MKARLFLVAALVTTCCLQVCLADVEPEQRTAAMPDSWLVLYNLNDFESMAWARWYRLQWGIPATNTLGLDADTVEHLPDRATANAQIIDPVKAYFDANPQQERRIMGLVLGWRLPTHFGTPPAGSSTGGYSVANALQDLTNSTTWEMNLDCPHMTAPYGAMPANGRLTKATMQPGHYMVGQIEAPSLIMAKELTSRARALGMIDDFFASPVHVWHDCYDPILPGGYWYWLGVAETDPDLADLDWQDFDSDTEQSPDDDFRFGTHDTRDWDDYRLYGIPPGRRVLAYNLNSWGATTVRSTTNDNARYVPNAVAAGYAAAIGATGEPQCCVAPFPDTLLGALRKGWTLGEAFYLANPYDDWMWTIVGDPLLRLRVPGCGGTKPPPEGSGDETPD